MIEVQKTGLFRKLYAQDASMYQELPEGVAFPENKSDISELVQKANSEGFTITPRSAGTSLAGQATGNGVVMDVSRYMTGITEINASEKWVQLQPGVIRDSLNRKTAKFNLLFGPDTATTNRCMIGGMIGNNSAGSYSIKYGSTREHTLEIEAVLSDGSEVVFKALNEQELEKKRSLQTLEGHIYRSMISLLERNKKLILENYPHAEIIRRNTGYALDKLCEMHPVTPGGREFNLCELLCGSEGTLALTTAAKLNIVDKPKYQQLLIPQFKSLDEAMLTAVEAVKYSPSAVELVDDVILNATKGNIEQSKNRFFLEGEPKCILIIQFEGNELSDLQQRSDALKQSLVEKRLGFTHSELSDPGRMAQVWELRKAGLGLLMGLGKESRTPAFCEDTAVRVQDLPDYVKDFQKILDKHDTSCVFYAHASVGELHLRPMIDTTTDQGIQKMRTMADEIAGLVRTYKGSLSGEHGDGRARAPYIGKVLGEELLPVLQQVKEIWDPNYIFNPGKIVSPKPIEQDLRYSPDYEPLKVDTVFQWRKEGSFNDAIELCNGAGVCRKLAESGGTMCPSYMATSDEKDSTRGRANVFRQVFSGEDPRGFESEELKEALDLCLSCKACKSECPANVDMAKMKSEFMHGWHQKHGITLRERFFGQASDIYPFAMISPGLSNLMIRSAFGKFIFNKLFGITPERTLPQFAPQTFIKWFRKRESFRSDKKVALFIDIFTNYHDTSNGMDTVRVLEKMGYEVLIPKVHEEGRPYFTKGLMDHAKKAALNVVRELYGYIDKGIPVVGIEPSVVLTIRDEYLDLLDDEWTVKVQKVAKSTFTFEEFISLNKSYLPSVKSSGKVLLHGHCHAKALIGNDPTIEALELVGYKVEVVDSGCCGMAGSFGYEQETYPISINMGEQRLFPAVKAVPETTEICAPGFSCRHQIKDGTGKSAKHPAHLILNKLA